MSIIIFFKNIQKKIKTKIDKLIEIIAINAIFILGIGTTYLASKLFSKKFLNKDLSTASWKKFEQNKNIKKMY